MFPAVKSKGSVAKVFFVITCIRFGLSMVSIVGFVEMFSFGEDSFYNNLGSVISVFVIGMIVNVVTLIMGIITTMKYTEAQKAYAAIAPKVNSAVGGSNAATPFGNVGNAGNAANNNSINYPNQGNTGYNAGGMGYNGANANNTGGQGNYQVNVHTNDPTQLRSATGDQSPFEAPPPNYNRYNYGNTGSYQQGRPSAPYQNPPQGTPVPPANNPAGYRQSPVSNTADANNTANIGKTGSNKYVSQMPEVTPFSGANPAAANTPAAQANTTVPQKPVVPVVVPVPPEIKRETTVRCKHCGVTNKEGDKFCTFCGKSLSE